VKEPMPMKSKAMNQPEEIRIQYHDENLRGA